MSKSASSLFPVTDPQAVAALRARWRRGEKQAALELLRPYEQPVYQVLRSLVVVEGEAVELALQVFTAAWRNGVEQELGKALLPWLLGLLIAQVRIYGRRERRGQHLEERLLLLLHQALRERPTVLTAAYGQSVERLAARREQARERLGAGAVTEVAFVEAPPLDLLALAEARAASAGPPRLERRSLVMSVLGAAVLAAALIWYFTARPGLDQPSSKTAVQVAELTGEVWRGPAATRQLLAAGARLSTNDRVATGQESAATLARPGLTIALGAEAVVELVAVSEAGLTLQLVAGELALSAERVPVVVRLGEGPRLIELDDGAVRLNASPRVVVDRGRVLVREGRRVVILGPGESSTFAWSNPGD